MDFLLISVALVTTVVLAKVTKSPVSIPFLCNLVFLLNGVGVYLYAIEDGRPGIFLGYISTWMVYFISVVFFIKLSLRKDKKLSENVNPSISIGPKRFRLVSIYCFFVFMVGSLYYSAGIPMLSVDPDVARFEQQNIPFFGILFRIIYWVLPYLSVAVLHIIRFGLNDRRRILYVWLPMFFAFLVAVVFSGSKGAIVQFVLCHLIYLSYTGVNFYRPKYLTLLFIIFSGSVFGAVFITSKYNQSDDIGVAAQVLVNRATMGAGEGYYKISSDYVISNGYGGGWYTFIKPWYTLGGTLKLIDKSDLTFDTGNYVAIYYRGVGNLAAYTYTIFGHGYLEGGVIPSIIVALFFSILVSSVHKYLIDNRNWSRMRFVLFLVVGWSMITLADWGYIDGWFVYSILTLIVFSIPFFFILFYGKRVNDII